MLAAIGLRQYPIKAEFRTMHPRRTRSGQLSAGWYHRPSHVGLGLPLTIITAGFTSGTNPNPTRHPYAGSPGRCEWAPYAGWSQSGLSKKCTRKLGLAQTGPKHRKGSYLHTQPTTLFLSGCCLLMRIQGDRGRIIKASPRPGCWLLSKLWL